MPSLQIDQLNVTYGRDDYAVMPIDGFDLTVEEGNLAVLLGPSGCGKTTLLSCLSGIQRPTSGSIKFGATEVTKLDSAGLAQYRRDTVGIVFQAFNLVPSLNAVENVMVPLRSHGVKRAAARHRAQELLTEVGLAERMHHHPGSLSGGQQQRVAIARALALNPPLIVADEPTASLDHVQVEVVLRILRGLTARGCTVIVSTHDNRLIPLADQLVEMRPDTQPSGIAAEARVHLDCGEVLFDQGSYGDRIYEILEGEMELLHVDTHGNERRLVTLGPGDQFGEMGPLFELPRSATARAATDCNVIAHSVESFRTKFGGQHIVEMIGRYAGGEAPEVQQAN